MKRAARVSSTLIMPGEMINFSMMIKVNNRSLKKKMMEERAAKRAEKRMVKRLENRADKESL
jgi:hypothetical protein